MDDASGSTPAPLVEEDHSSSDESAAPTRKRQRRIALACNRCKSRKQRCNMEGRGPNDPCKSCEKAGADCVLQEKPPKTEYPAEYISFLEGRIASLEARLADYSPDDTMISDHLPPKQIVTAGGEPPEVEGVGEDNGQVKNEIAAGVALLSLNSVSEPHYLGGSSGYSWAKVLLGTLHRPASSLFKPTETFHSRHRSQPTLTRPALPAREVANALIDSFYMHVQARYAFVDWRKLRDILARQEELVVPKGKYAPGTPEWREKGAASFFVWMVYAIGARLLQGVPLPGVADPEAYYAAALEHMDVIVTLHNVENVQAFLYLVMYSLRCAEGPSVWHLTGIAMKMCIELGMHRRRKVPKGTTAYAEEIRKRTWWTVYGLDRWFALTLGRPLGIDDRDVDQTLPLDINCDADVPTTSTMNTDSPVSVDDTSPTRPFTSMSSALHVIRLRRIEAQIQKTVYRVDQRRDSQNEVRLLLEKIDRWREAIPKRPVGPGWQSVPCCSEDWFLMKGEATRLLLLRPLTAKAKAGDTWLTMAAQSAAQLCEIFRRLHQNYPLANSLSLTDLHSIFLTGLTLLHLLLSHPRVLPLRESSKAIRACSTALFVYAQHFRAAEPFRDAFEDMANACLDACEKAEDDKPVKDVETRDMQNEWERHVGEMAAWMMNANAQKEFLELVTSLGFNPNVPLDIAQPAPQEQELLFAPQQPFQVPVYGGVPELYPSIQGVAEQTIYQQQLQVQQVQQVQQIPQIHQISTGLAQTMAPPPAPMLPTPSSTSSVQTPDITTVGHSSGPLPFERAFATGDWFSSTFGTGA